MYSVWFWATCISNRSDFMGREVKNLLTSCSKSPWYLTFWFFFIPIKGWCFPQWFSSSWSPQLTTWWYSSPATVFTATEPGSTNTTKSTCGSTVSWCVRTLDSKLVFNIKSHKLLLWDTSRWNSTLLSLLQVQNGLAIYATWTTIASLVNLTIVLTRDANMSQMDAATLSLSILTVVLVVW